MTLLKRLGFFMIGCSVGIVLVSFFWKKKNTEFCYFPNCRVLKDLRQQELFVAPSVYTKIMDSAKIHQLVEKAFVDGDVDFSNSDTHDFPKTYTITIDNFEVKALRTKDSIVQIMVIDRITP